MITGSSGLLGRSLVSVLSDTHEVVGMDKYLLEAQKGFVVDITQRERILESIVAISPAVVVHTAAETNVDRCEVEQDLARRINVDGTANIADACVKTRAKMILISTDYVFDGAKGDYAEADEPNPVSFYGHTKLEAERITAATLPNSLIVRTSVLYGWHPTKLNFATWVVKRLREHQTLRVADDHINSPTFADDLARAIKGAIEQNSKGTLHIAGKEKASRFAFAWRIAKKFELDEGLLIPVEMKDLGWIARRPRDSSLNVGKAEKELHVELFGINRGLGEMVRSGS